MHILGTKEINLQSHCRFLHPVSRVIKCKLISSNHRWVIHVWTSMRFLPFKCKISVVFGMSQNDQTKEDRFTFQNKKILKYQNKQDQWIPTFCQCSCGSVYRTHLPFASHLNLKPVLVPVAYQSKPVQYQVDLKHSAAAAWLQCILVLGMSASHTAQSWRQAHFYIKLTINWFGW